ncbi:MAG: Tm-1-like ATP-binding domain-containing protein [Pseudomonadota bacterium]
MAKVVVAGTFDSKTEPLGLLVDLLRARGEDPVTIDTSVFEHDYKTTWSSAAVAEAAGKDHATLAARGRSEAISVMSEGAAIILRRLVDMKGVSALVGLGGSNAATIFARLARELPIGIPKILMSTSVVGDNRGIVGGSDAVLLYPVVDIDGSNAILDRMVERLADTAVALKSEPLSTETRGKKRIGLSMYGVTTPCVHAIATDLRKAGMEPLIFHANGPGGRSLEAFAAEGLVDAVVDATLAELGNELLGGGFPAGPDRLTGATRAGIPQIVAPGAIDMIAFGPRNTVPERFEDHVIHAHNALVTLVRTTQAECHAIGVRLAERMGTPAGSATLCIPLGGTSMLDKPGGVFCNPEAVAAFSAGFSSKADPTIRVVTSKANINDPEFASLMVAELNEILNSDGPVRAGATG